MLPSGPAVSQVGPLPAVGTENSVKAPPVVTRPILLPANSTNHRLPSAPVMMPLGLLPAVGIANCVKVPLRVTRAMLLPSYSVNHRFPSGPAVMPLGVLFGVGTENSVSAPDGVIRPMRPASSANQRLPSGPGVIAANRLPAVGNGNSVMVPVTGAALTLGTGGSRSAATIEEIVASVMPPLIARATRKVSGGRASRRSTIDLLAPRQFVPSCVLVKPNAGC